MARPDESLPEQIVASAIGSLTEPTDAVALTTLVKNSPDPERADDLVSASIGGDKHDSVPASAVLSKKQLIDAVVTRTGVKRREARPAVEAVLAIMGEAMAEGRVLNLSPFGKLRTARVKAVENAQIIVARIRRRAPAADDPAMPLAQPAE